MSVAKSSLRCVAWLMLAGILLASTSCTIEFGHDPAKTVTVEVSGVNSDAHREEIQETLEGMTDGSGHVMTTSWSGDRMTVRLSPVGDVKAFSRKINFGEVTEVDGRTIKVQFIE